MGTELSPEEQALLQHTKAHAETQLAGTTEEDRTWKSNKPPMVAERHESRSQWKIADLVERMGSEEPIDLIRDECTRLAGRLEAKGMQRVRVDIRWTDATQIDLYVSVGGHCPCGAEKLGVVERWPVDLFRDGPHTFEARLTQIEIAILGGLDAKA